MSPAPQPVDLLVAADFLYPMTDGLPVIAGGEVAIADGRIVHAGPARPLGTMRERRVLGIDEESALAAVKRSTPRWRELLRGWAPVRSPAMPAPAEGG